MAHEYVAGHPLYRCEPVPDDFFPPARLAGGDAPTADGLRGPAQARNILVGDDGRPHLIDFQISDSSRAAGRPTRRSAGAAGASAAQRRVPSRQTRLLQPRRPRHPGPARRRAAAVVGAAAPADRGAVPADAARWPCDARRPRPAGAGGVRTLRRGRGPP